MHRSFLILFPLVTLVVSAGAESTDIHFRGILDLGTSRAFSVATDGGARTAWVTEGDVFAGYKVVEFKSDDNSLVLRRNGDEITVWLASGGAPERLPAPAPTTIDEATELLNSMKFEEMLATSMEQQREMMADFSRQMMQQMGQEVDEEAIALQMRILDTINEQMDWPNLQEEVARLYGETFTSQELRGLIDFYSTPAGQAFIDKQPDINKGMMAILQPRIMQAIPKIQEMTMEAMMKRHDSGTGEPD